MGDPMKGTVNIKLRGHGHGHIWVNGRRLNNVVAIRFETRAGGLNIVTIELLARNVRIHGDAEIVVANA